MRTIKHKFVEYIPDVIDEQVLYVSVQYRTAVHQCVCGCGNKVVTPLSPTDWKLTFNGREVSLYPSIGNWGFDCRSHYWIKNGTVEMAESWSDKMVASGREEDRRSKERYYDEKSAPVPKQTEDSQEAGRQEEVSQESWLDRIMFWRR